MAPDQLKPKLRSGVVLLVAAAILAAACGLVLAPAYSGEDALGYYFGRLVGGGLLLAAVVWVILYLAGRILRRRVGLLSVPVVLAAAIFVPAVPVLIGYTAGAVFNGDLHKIADMARNTYAAQDRAYDIRVQTVGFDRALNGLTLGADPDFKIIREKIRLTRKINADYRAEVRGRRVILVNTLEKKKVSGRKQAEFLAHFDAEMAKTEAERNLVWELEDAFLIETDHLVEVLNRTQPEWQPRRQRVVFKSEADFRSFETYFKRLQILSEELRKVRYQALVLSSRPASRPAGPG